MSETPDPTRLNPEDEALWGIMQAFDESHGCEHAPSVQDFCCQWNSRTPCRECAELERRTRQALQDVRADLQAENARLTAALHDIDVTAGIGDNTGPSALAACRAIRRRIGAALTPKGETP